MIDKLVLRCWLKPGYPVLETLGVPLAGVVHPDRTVTDLHHRWESIPSFFSSLAFRLFYDPQFGTEAPPEHLGAQMPIRGLQVGPRSHQQWRPYVEIQGSPAKLAQGHNVYGSDDLEHCALVLCRVFFEAYPQLVDWLDHDSWEVVESDVTYFSRAPSQRHAEQFIAAVDGISAGQTRGRTGYSTTAYFGRKNSRIKKLKVYLKQPELLADFERVRDPLKRARLKRVVTDELIQWCEGMVRFEATVKTRWFQRRGLPTRLADLIPVFDASAIWREAWQDIVKALSGERIVIVNDEQVEAQLKQMYGMPVLKDGQPVCDRNGNPKVRYTKAQAVFRLYRAIRLEGWDEARRTIAKPTFYRLLKLLTACTDISLVQLQNMGPQGSMNVVPLMRFIQVDFAEQVPPFARVA